MREFSSLHQDLRFGIRQLRHNPEFAVTAILTIGLGIGATTAIFSVADAVLFRPLPYPNSHRLVMVWTALEKILVNRQPVSAEDFEAYRSDTHVFQTTVAFQLQDRTVVIPGDAERVPAIASTPGLLQLLGGSIVIGRSLSDNDWRPDHSQVAVISYSLFRRRFSGDPRAIGRTMHLDERAYSIVGVLRQGFEFNTGSGSPEVWTPLPPVAARRKAQFAMVGLLNPGIGIPAAQQAVSVAAKHLERAIHPYRGPNGEDPGYTARVVSLRDELFGSYRTGTILLMTSVLLVLSIACVNVISLLMARAVARDRETAIRHSLGATRSRLVRQWMTEAAVLVALGGSLGVAASRLGILLIAALLPSEIARAVHIGVDTRVLGFTAAVSIAICFVFAVAPLVNVSFARGGSRSLRGPGRVRRISGILVSSEVALAFVLVAGSGLLLESFDRLRKIDTGFRSDHLLTMEINLSGQRYEQGSKRVQFFSRLQRQLEQLPGVLSASGVDRLPVFTAGVDTRGGNPFSIDGRPFDPNHAARQLAHTQTVETGYFETMRIPLLDGRAFSDSDTADSPPVAIINRTLARNVFPGGEAVGKRILKIEGRWMTIVGVIGDIRTGALDLPPMQQFYTPAAQDAPSHMFAIVRTVRDPAGTAHAAGSLVRQLDPAQPVEHIQTMDEHVEDTMGQVRFQTVLLSFFGFTALSLAGVGVYGVTTHATMQRTKEIGIRIALGADRRSVIQTVLGGALRPVVAGLLTGLATALMVTRLLSSSLYEVQPNDPVTMAAGLLLACVAVLACALPVRRATGVDPMVTLRHE